MSPVKYDSCITPEKMCDGHFDEFTIHRLQMKLDEMRLFPDGQIASLIAKLTAMAANCGYY